MTTEEQYDNNSIGNQLEVQRRKPSRPLGVTIVSAFIILLNLWFIIFTLIRRHDYLAGYGRPPFMSMSVSAILVDIFMYTIFVLIGFAFWRGKKLSWWLCVFYWFYELIVNTVFLIILFTSGEGAYTIARGVALSVIRITVLLLTILYFFENPSFVYFDLDTRLKLRYAVYLMIGAIITILLQNFLQA